MSEPMPLENTFDHLRALDKEHVGYIHVTGDGRFIPFDLLQRQAAGAMELDAAEDLLDELGLRMFADMTTLIEVPLPTDRLQQL